MKSAILENIRHASSGPAGSSNLVAVLVEQAKELARHVFCYGDHLQIRLLVVNVFVNITSLSVSKASIILTMLGWSSSLWILHSDLSDRSSRSL